MPYPPLRLPLECKSKLKDTLSELPLRERLHEIMLWLTEQSRSKSKYMLYMIMYDIENNKVRTHIAKYLIKKGCLRIQKSVYLAKGTSGEMNEISQALKAVNEVYANEDSIFVLPIPQEKFNNMKVIGKNITFDVVTKSKNVLIF